eukprot:g6766.t1
MSTTNDTVVINVFSRGTGNPVGVLPKNLGATSAIPKDVVKSVNKYTKSQVYDYVMKQSVFALVIRGYGLSSYRLFEALSYGAIPVILSDPLILPFSDMGINWNDIAVRMPETALMEPKAFIKRLKAISEDKSKVAKMQRLGHEAYVKYLDMNSARGKVINKALDSSLHFIQGALKRANISNRLLISKPRRLRLRRYRTI